MSANPTDRSAPAAGAQDRYMTSSPASASLTRLELAMNRAMESLMRWSLEGHKNLVDKSLTYPDLLLLHAIRMRGRAEGLMEVLTFVNRHDLSNIQYSLKKLENHGLIARIAGPGKREVTFEPTEAGNRVTERYATIRQACLVELVEELAPFERQLADAAATLERLVGFYEQATQRHSTERILGFGGRRAAGTSAVDRASAASRASTSPRATATGRNASPGRADVAPRTSARKRPTPRDGA